MNIIPSDTKNGNRSLQARAKETADTILREVHRYAPEDQTGALQQLMTDWLATCRDPLLSELVTSEIARRLRLPVGSLKRLIQPAQSNPVTLSPYRALTVTALQNYKTGNEEADFLDLATIEPKEVDWLVDRLLARGKITLLDAPPGAAKTSFAVALTHAVSTGTRFIGLDTVPSKSVWLQFEMSGEDLALKYELLGERTEGHIFIDPDPEPLRDGYTRLVNGVLRHGITLVIADLFFDWLAVEDYNDIAQARASMSLVRRFTNDTGCAVLGIRHVFKGASLHSPHAGAGSHIYAGKADFLLTLEADLEQSDVATLRCVKSRYGNLRAWSMSLRLKDGRFLPIEEPQEQPLHQQVADFVASRGRRVTKGEILESFPAYSEPTVRRALEKAVSFGLLCMEYDRQRRSTAVYWTPETEPATGDQNCNLATLSLSRAYRGDRVTALQDYKTGNEEAEEEDPFSVPEQGSLAYDPISGHWYPRRKEGGDSLDLH